MLRDWARFMVGWLAVVLGALVVVSVDSLEVAAAVAIIGTVIVVGFVAAFLSRRRVQRRDREAALRDFEATGILTIEQPQRLATQPGAKRFFWFLGFLCLCAVMGLIINATELGATQTDRLIAYGGLVTFAVGAAIIYKRTRPPLLYSEEAADPIEPPPPRVPALPRNGERTWPQGREADR